MRAFPSTLPVSACRPSAQSLAVLSPLPVSTQRPSGDTATLYTQPLWPTWATSRSRPSRFMIRQRGRCLHVASNLFASAVIRIGAAVVSSS